MIKKYSQLFLSTILITDLCIIILSWLFSYFLRFYTPLFPIILGIPPFIYYFNFILVMLLIFPITLKFSGIYHGFIVRSRIDEFLVILNIISISVLIMLGTTFFYREFSYSRTVMIIFFLITPVFLFVNHEIIKVVIRLRRKRGYNLQKVLIVGAGNIAETLIDKIKSHPEIGFEIIGILTLNDKEPSGKIYDIPVLGNIKALKEIYNKYLPQQIFITLPVNAYKHFEGIVDSLSNETVDIKVVPDLLKYILVNPTVDNFDGIPIVSLSESPLWGWNRIAKRIIDICFSIVLLILISPVMLIIAAIIKLNSKGQVFYKQERMGLDGGRFFMYKFRTMSCNAEEGTGPKWAIKNDNRCTKVGTFLRKTSIDELPQFINVLRGDMSFVGPRPERPIFVEQFKKSIPLYMLRHKVKAGITGWAQVNGWRGNTSLEKRIEYDLFYIEHWSLIFDLKIMFLTIWKGLIGKNAY